MKALPFLFFVFLCFFVVIIYIFALSSRRIPEKKIIIDQISKDPLIFTIDDFLNDKEIDHFIKIGRVNLEPSRLNSKIPIDEKVRRSKTSMLKDSDHVVKKIRKRISTILGCKKKQFEKTQFLHYESGGFYKPHYDYFRSLDEYGKKKKQRLWTVLIYLNDVDYEDGGATYFEKLDLSVQPKKGTALLWRNLDSKGNGNTKTLHCGNPLDGNAIKEALNIWIREK